MLDFVINNIEYVISGVILACSFIVNIIQLVRSKVKNKVKEAICRIPDYIRFAEQKYIDFEKSIPFDVSTTTTIDKGIYKKSLVESFLMIEYGEKFAKKYMKVFDDAIEDILNTPQKKGGSSDGISKENETR